jgi:hypothetical protein
MRIGFCRNKYSFKNSIEDILTRLDNLHHSIPTSEKASIEKVQARRSRIEHHRYDHKEEDGTVIAESLKFIMYFVEFWLDANVGTEIGPELLAKIQLIIFSYNEREGLAEYRLKQWMKKHWPDWDEEQSDYPEEFEGTYDCPICDQCHLVIERRTGSVRRRGSASTGCRRRPTLRSATGRPTRWRSTGGSLSRSTH